MLNTNKSSIPVGIINKDNIYFMKIAIITQKFISTELVFVHKISINWRIWRKQKLKNNCIKMKNYILFTKMYIFVLYK